MSSKYNDLAHSGSEMNMGTCESEIKHPESLKDDARTLSNSKFMHNLSYIILKYVHGTVKKTCFWNGTIKNNCDWYFIICTRNSILFCIQVPAYFTLAVAMFTATLS